MKARDPHWWFATFLVIASFLSVYAQAAQKDLQKFTVGYTPIGGAAIPLYIGVEEKIFQKHGYDIFPCIYGRLHTNSFRQYSPENFPSATPAAARSSPAGFSGECSLIDHRLALARPHNRWLVEARIEYDPS